MTDTDVYLFIGGPWDGRRERVPELSVVRITADDYYQKRMLMDDETRLAVFVHDSVKPGCMMQLILDGYRKP